MFRPLIAAALLGLAPLPLAAGSLTLHASGEDLATAGFTAPRLSKDGWALEFTRILVTLDRITAYQTEPPFMADGPAIDGAPLAFAGPVTVDLVAADAADLVELATVPAPPGHFNALAWALVPAPEGAAEGASLHIDGIARRDGQEVAFTLTTADALLHACGEYIGDTRKGFVTEGGAAELEITFHLDHLFGRADKPADDPMNLDAPGFDPFGSGGAHAISLDGLHLGHVGEGHCHVTPL